MPTDADTALGDRSPPVAFPSLRGVSSLCAGPGELRQHSRRPQVPFLWERSVHTGQFRGDSDRSWGVTVLCSGNCPNAVCPLCVTNKFKKKVTQSRCDRHAGQELRAPWWSLGEKLALALSGGRQKLHLTVLKAEWQREQQRSGMCVLGGCQQRDHSA